jgi:hypothetical protein
MKKSAFFTLCITLFVSTCVFAYLPAPCIHTINFQLQAEQWAKTTTARVIVSFNGTTNTEGLTELHTQVLENLNKISSKSEWHITQFNRQPDKSGLEKVYVQAESRLPESELAALRETAKNISKPGATFEIDDIQFSPSTADIQQTKMDLRKKLYETAKTELTQVNQTYPDYHYQLHQITFNGLKAVPVMEGRKLMSFAASAKNGTAPVIAVSQKIVMTADVQLARKMKRMNSKNHKGE